MPDATDGSRERDHTHNPRNKETRAQGNKGRRPRALALGVLIRESLFRPSWLRGFVAPWLLLLPACQTPQAMPKEFGEAFRSVAASAADQAAWERILGRVRGHVNNPGIRTGGGIEYFGYVQLVGADGDVSVEADGKGGTLSPQARQVILAQFKENPTFAAELIRLIQAASKTATEPRSHEATQGEETGGTPAAQTQPGN